MAPNRDVDGASGTGEVLPEVLREVPKVKSRKWLVGCVRGSVDGYRRGKVSLRRVNSHVRIAVTHGVSQEELTPLLVHFGLRWDLLRAAVIDAGSYSAGAGEAMERLLELLDSYSGKSNERAPVVAAYRAVCSRSMMAAALIVESGARY